MNAGPIIHPPLILMNAGPLEHFERWDIHKEGTQPSIRRVTDALDEERIAVREALGYPPYHFPLRDHYTTDRWMYGNAHDKLTDSGDWREHIDLTQHRYMREDVEYGLAFLVSVARMGWRRKPGRGRAAGAWLGRARPRLAPGQPAHAGSARSGASGAQEMKLLLTNRDLMLGRSGRSAR